MLFITPDSEILQALHEINRSINSSVNPAVVGLIAGLFGSLFGGIISYVIARRKLTADIVSQHRREWLNVFRNTTRELFTEYDVIILSKYILNEVEEKYILSIQSKYHLLVLMLNPNAKDKGHQRDAKVRLNEIHKFIVELQKPSSQETQKNIQQKYHDLQSRTIDSFIIVFQDTWKQIKNIE